MEIIPAIDLIDGRCVRLAQGDFARSCVYEAPPLEMAKRFEEAGCRALHLVDLDGARGGAPKNLSVLEAICSQTELVVDFSGGIRREEDIASVFRAGAAFIVVGSAAVKTPEEVARWLEVFSPEKFIFGADVRGRHLAISGWEENTDISIGLFVREWREKGVSIFLSTSIQRDGLLEGPDFALYRELQAQFPDEKFIVSGGVSSIQDLREFEEQGAQAVIVGRAFYEGQISLESVQEFLC